MKKSIIKFFGMAMIAVSIGSTVVSCNSNDPVVTPVSPLDRNNIQGEIKNGETFVLESGEYKLTGPLIVKDGGKLIINAGVKVVGTKFVGGQEVRYIAISQGGKIEVNGTKDKPVIMTSEELKPGSWGGLVICGRAPINIGSSGIAEVSGLNYGGADAKDNSGSIKYLQILYSGYSYNTEKEFNGLSMFGVGNGTTIEYVQVHDGSDDGFEWFGGTVNTKYLVSTSSEDDSFDWTEGWVGENEYWYGKLGLGRGNRGIEADNNLNNNLATPISYPTIKHITLIGLGDQGTEPQAIKLRVGTKANIDNIVLSNWKTGIDIQHDAGKSYVLDGSIKLTNVRFENIVTEAVGRDSKGESYDVSQAYTKNQTATGAGAGTEVPEWAKGWTVGL